MNSTEAISIEPPRATVEHGIQLGLKLDQIEASRAKKLGKRRTKSGDTSEQQALEIASAYLNQRAGEAAAGDIDEDDLPDAADYQDNPGDADMDEFVDDLAGGHSSADDDIGPGDADQPPNDLDFLGDDVDGSLPGSPSQIEFDPLGFLGDSLPAPRIVAKSDPQAAQVHTDSELDLLLKQIIG